MSDVDLLAVEDEASEFAAAVEDWCSAHWTTDLVRAAWTAPRSDAIRAAWVGLAEMGTFALLLPDGDGGLGLSDVHLAVVARALGHHAVPGPAIETILTVPLLARVGMTEEACAGSIVVTTDLGSAPALAHAGWADRALLLREHRLDLVELDGARTTPLDTVDWSRGAALVEEARPLRSWTPTPEDVGLARRRGTLASAATLVGLAEAALAQAVTHVRQREQFGVPVGAFQALQHQLVDAHTRIALAWPTVLAAASGDDDVPAESAAKVGAVEAAEATARIALQAHGAIGYTREHPLHLHLARIWSSVDDFGSRDEHLRRLEEALRLNVWNARATCRGR